MVGELDVLGMVSERLLDATLDHDYLRTWAVHLDIAGLLDDALA